MTSWWLTKNTESDVSTVTWLVREECWIALYGIKVKRSLKGNVLYNVIHRSKLKRNTFHRVRLVGKPEISELKYCSKYEHKVVENPININTFMKPTIRTKRYVNHQNTIFCTQCYCSLYLEYHFNYKVVREL